MNSQGIEPRLGAEAFSCPHCNAVAHQDWYALFLKRERAAEVGVLTPEAAPVATPVRAESERDSMTERGQLVERLKKNELTYAYQTSPIGLKVKMVNLHVSHCQTCNGFTLWVGGRPVFPINVDKVSAPLVEEDFEEAAAILTKSPRGAVALMRVCIQKVLPLLKHNGSGPSEYNTEVMRKGLEVEIQEAMEVLQVLRSDPLQLTNFDSQEDKEVAFRFINSLKAILERRKLKYQNQESKERPTETED
jgi:hypothetical protein